MEQINFHSPDQVAAENQRFMVKVYTWMTFGVSITGFVSLFVANSPELQAIFLTGFTPIILIIAQIGLVFYLAKNVMSMSAGRAMGVFLFYSAVMGLSLSAIFIVYTKESIQSTFFIAGGTFAAVSFFGYTTKRDLSGMGHFLMMGLIGIIIASVVNWFTQSSGLAMIINYGGVLLFVGLTAYDTQKIKAMNIIGNEGTEEDTKEAISGALHLYLDFINLFLFMLRIMGGRR